MKDLKQLIRESINEYIKAIDEAGHKAGMEARMAATQEAIDKRKKMTALDELDEDMKGMIDEKKVKDINAEVKALEKSLAKLQKQLDKLTSKGKKTEKVEATPEPEEIIDEISLGETLTPEEENELAEIEQLLKDAANSESAINPKMYEKYKMLKAKKGTKEPMNESFLYMQKLAGVITEAQFQSAKKVLNEGEYSDWWAKADDELGLDFGDDIYSYVDNYDEPWQGKFADEVVNIDADDYEDFKNQVKQLYDEINPF